MSESNYLSYQTIFFQKSTDKKETSINGKEIRSKVIVSSFEYNMSTLLAF